MRRPLLLTGFMATGKSTVGRKLAELSGQPFVDLDAQIEAEAGRSIAEIFAREGESSFRALERRALETLLDHADGPVVVALGGGALLARDLRLRALDSAVVVCLHASAAEILARCRDTTSRPLLAGADPAARVAELLEARAAAYNEAHARLLTDQRSPESLAQEALAIWRADSLVVAAGAETYCVEIGSGLLGLRTPAFTGKPSRVVLVSDRTVHELYGARAARALGSPSEVVLEPGEEHKRIESITTIWQAALAAGADRKSLFVGFGGGVVTDMTGFAAASYMRGVPWLCVPTTLLAMVDASVGGKTGIDLASAKNAVGAFHQPRGVLCDVDLLASETPRNFRSALSEVIKTALIGDPQLLDYLEQQQPRVTARVPEVLTEIVRRSIRVKARIVSEDPRELGRRALLNLGHTIGHALESVAGYSRLTHGEAISLGLVAALEVGRRLGHTPPDLGVRVRDLLECFGLPTQLGNEPLEAASSLIGHDKKRAGAKIRFVFAHAAGDVRTHDLELEDVQRHARALLHPAA